MTYDEMMQDLLDRGYQVAFKHYRPALYPVYCAQAGELFFTLTPPARYSRKRGFMAEDFRGMPPFERGGATACWICGEGITIGFAHCSKSDNFCYKTGREISLARAYGALKNDY